MEDEMLKANEFEHGVDGPYNVHKSFQQLYGPETNYSYRADSAEEILGDQKKLMAMIMDHYTVQCPRLAALDNYMKARNDGIYDDESRRIEENRADHRVAHNFAKVINVFDVGYNTGVPIKKVSDIDRVNEIIKKYDDANDIEALDSELWRDMKKYGRAYELQYRNEKDQDRSVISNVFETFVCYGTDVERTPLFAVRYPRYRIGTQERVRVFVYTDTEVISYKTCEMAALKLEEENREPHEWGEVPVTEYSPDRYRMGGYEDVIPQIDAYDAAQSDTANYMTDLNEATLVISGDLNLQKYTVKELVEMKKANLLLLSSGVNPDGSREQTDAKYVYKQYDVTGAEAYKDRLQKDIHKISMVPDLTDEAFAGTQSGEAMKYKLFGFQQIAKSGQRGFKKGLMRRYRLLMNIKHFVNEADNTDLGNLTITFTPNLPKAILEELKALVEAGMEISQETLMGLASFIEDIQAEMERIRKEKEESQNDVVMRQMFGGARMDSQTYWKNREAKQRKHNIRDEAEYQKHILEIYQNMIDEIEKEINGFYGKYAKKEGITMAEAKKRAAKADIEALGRKAARYVKDKDFSQQANEEMRLYNMTMKVNRLELLKAQIGLEMVAGFDELQKYYDKILTDRTISEFERQAGILGKTIQNNAKAADAIVNASFHNATYSDRIWMYQDMLKNELSSLLQTGLIQGQNPRRLATHLRKRFGVNQSNAERLMITELARVQTEAQKQSFERNGFEEYTFLALGTACPICRALDGKHFKIKKMLPGTNAPPMHPRCKCSTSAYENSEDYEEWLDFLDKGGTTEEWNKRRKT